MSETFRPYPIVLAHGIARFDFLTDSLLQRLNQLLWNLSRAADGLHYFKGVATYLEQHDFQVYKTRVSFAADVSVRAAELGQQVRDILAASGQPKVHVIGHSMGGLDARHMIVDEGMADQVASLTTVGTPHLGTSFADWGLRHGGDDAIRALRHILDLDGFLTLTPAARATFNQRAQHQEATNGVQYITYASAEERARVFGLIRPSWELIHEADGANDGLVPVTSQAWTDRLTGDNGGIKPVRQHRFPFPADHLNQIAWWDLDELRRPLWWRPGLWRRKRAFEQAVRDQYLRMARAVRHLR